MDKVYIRRIFPSTPPQSAISKKRQAVKVCGATAKRLDLDRLAAFCYTSILVGLRLSKPRLSESSRALARFAAPAATVTKTPISNPAPT